MKSIKHVLGILCVLAIVVTAHAQSFLTNGLVAYYPFNGNANDASGNGHNGTNSGATLTTDRFGAVNSAYTFSGGYISVPMSADLNITSNRTFSCWFYAAGNQTGGRIYESTVGNSGIGTYSGNTMDAWYVGNTHECNVTGLSFILNQWNHLVYTTEDSTGIGRVFLNGVLAASRTGAVLTASQNWTNKFLRFGIGNSGEVFYGAIDDVRIYNRNISANEVLQLNAYESTPIIALNKFVNVSSTNLHVGTNYVVQTSTDLLNWTNYGSVFTATTNVWNSTNYWPVANWNQLFFRIKQQ